MECKTALLLALLIAASQAAPQGQVQDGAAQQTNSSTAATGTNTSSSASGGSGSSGQSGTGGSTSSSAQNPIAAIISIIPNAINTERERISNAVQQLVSQQVNAATDSIGAAAQTGGQFLSNGVKVVASWPTFWANLLG